MVAEIPSRKPTTDAESLFITEEKSFAPKPKVLSLSPASPPQRNRSVPFRPVSLLFVPMPGTSTHAQAWLLLLFFISIRTRLCSADDLIRSFPPSAMVLPLALSTNSSRPSFEGNFRRLLRREMMRNTPNARMRLYDDLLTNGYFNCFF